jgi:hypothetical protein
MIPFLDPKPVGGPTHYLLVRGDSLFVEGEEAYSGLLEYFSDFS